MGGLHRSGTSLLARALGDHPDASAFSGTGVPEDEGQHLQDVLPSAMAHGGPGRFGFAPGAHLTEASPLARPETSAALWDAWAPHWDLSRPLLVEKSPPNILRTRLLQELFPGARFVIVTRHPVAVALATSKWGKPWEGMRPGRLVEHWVRCHDILRADAPLVRNLEVVRYEDLVSDPEAQLARLQRFAGLDPRPTRVEVRTGVNDAYFERWRGLARGPVGRAYMDAVDRRLADRVAEHGYSLREPALAGAAQNGA